jgi:hypothetical protein
VPPKKQPSPLRSGREVALASGRAVSGRRRLFLESWDQTRQKNEPTGNNIKHNRPDIIILNKQQKQAYLLNIAVPNSHNITKTYNTKINKYLELSVAMRNLWCLEKISILPLVISATGIVPQSLFKNL